MTREEAKKFLPIIQAFAEGKTIQIYDDEEEKWIDITFEDLYFNCIPSYYRIKPEPEYRPFKTQEECWNEMLKHQPFGWVKNEYNYVHIECVLENVIEFSPVEDDDGTLLTCTIDFTSVCEEGYTFADGTPFGIKE